MWKQCDGVSDEPPENDQLLSGEKTSVFAGLKMTAKWRPAEMSLFDGVPKNNTLRKKGEYNNL